MTTIDTLKKILDRDDLSFLLSEEEINAIHASVEHFEKFKWHSIEKEGFPKEEGVYIVMFNDYYLPQGSTEPVPFLDTKFLYYDPNNENGINWAWRVHDPIAWMPLPFSQDFVKLYLEDWAYER